MKLSEKIAAIESGEYAVTWTTPDGSIMKAADYGPYYVVYRNGEPMGAIDSPDDLDIFTLTGRTAESDPIPTPRRGESNQKRGEKHE